MLKRLFLVTCAVSFIGGFVTGKSVLAADFDDEMKCMADNMYWESRNQSFRGLIAVGNVVMNRVADPRFPNTICEVVKQGPEIKSWISGKYFPKRDSCQFSWYCDGKSDEIPEQDKDLYEYVRALAVKVSSNFFGDLTNGATHYHAYYVRPDWAETKTPTVRVDAHIFYRWER